MDRAGHRQLQPRAISRHHPHTIPVVCLRRPYFFNPVYQMDRDGHKQLRARAILRNHSHNNSISDVYDWVKIIRNHCIINICYSIHPPAGVRRVTHSPTLGWNAHPVHIQRLSVSFSQRLSSDFRLVPTCVFCFTDYKHCVGARLGHIRLENNPDNVAFKKRCN